MLPWNLNDSTIVTVLWEECRGVPPEVQNHLQCFERIELQFVVTAPDSLLFNLLSVSRFISVLDEANDDCSVVRKLQELDRGAFRGAVIYVQGEEQWGENATLGSTSAKSENPGHEE